MNGATAWFFGLSIFAVLVLSGGFDSPVPDYATEHGGKAVLYSTDWCGYCEKTRKLFKKNNIAYYEYDIEKSSKGYDQYKELGGRGVPLVLINGVVIKGYNPREILSLSKEK